VTQGVGDRPAEGPIEPHSFGAGKGVDRACGVDVGSPEDLVGEKVPDTG
jgi:hypothetical protein